MKSALRSLLIGAVCVVAAGCFQFDQLLDDFCQHSDAGFCIDGGFQPSDAGNDAGVVDAGHVDGGDDAGVADGGDDAGQVDGGDAGSPFDAGVFTLTINIQPGPPDAGGSVSYGSNHCPPECAPLFSNGEQVTLTENPAPRFGFEGWSATQDAGTLSVTMSSDQTVTAYFSPYNYVFVTSAQFAPWTLGSRDGGDDFCNAAAADAGLHGHYVVWLGSTGAPAANHLGTARGWIRTDGLPFADLPSSLVAGQVFYPPEFNEKGTRVIPPPLPTVMTGTSSGGSVGQTCSDWTDAGAFGSQGDCTGGTELWMNNNAASGCSGAIRYYCFGIDHNVPLGVRPLPPDAGRLMWVSQDVFFPDGGLSSADALCQNEADDAGYGNRTFLAFLATYNAPAGARFWDAGQPWFRPDGVQVTQQNTDLLGAMPLLWAAPNVAIDGTYLSYANTIVWTGATSPALNSTGGNDCLEWSSLTGTYSGEVGWPSATDGQFFGIYSATCSNYTTNHVYCVEP